MVPRSALINLLEVTLGYRCRSMDEKLIYFRRDDAPLPALVPRIDEIPDGYVRAILKGTRLSFDQIERFIKAHRTAS